MTYCFSSFGVQRLYFFKVTTHLKKREVREIHLKLSIREKLWKNEIVLLMS